jgi:hypothetical protein
MRARCGSGAGGPGDGEQLAHPVRDDGRGCGAVGDTAAGMTRRALLRHGSGVALGATVVWSVPSMRSTALAAQAAGTPPPVRPQQVTRSVPSTPAARTDPTNPAAVRSGTLPLTGTDPRPLLIAGGTAIAAGTAMLAIAQDREPARGES